MSSSPLRRRCRVDSSSGKVASMPAAGAATVPRSTSMVSSRAGSASNRPHERLADLRLDLTGTRPHLVALLRKMSAKRGEMTAWKP